MLVVRKGRDVAGREREVGVGVEWGYFRIFRKIGEWGCNRGSGKKIPNKRLDS